MKKAIAFYIFLVLCYLLVAAGCRSRAAEPVNSLEQESAAVANQAAAAATAAAEVASGKRIPFVPVPDDGPAAAMATVQALDPQTANNSQEEISEQAQALASQAAEILGQAAGALGQVELPDFSGVLIEQLTSIQISDDNVYSLAFTDAQMTQSLQSAQAANGNGSALQSPTVQFTNGQMVLSGTMTEPNLGQVSVTVLPYVANGRLQVDVISATVSGTPIPAFVLQGAEATLNSTLSAAADSLPADFTLQQVIITEGMMQVTAVKA